MTQYSKIEGALEWSGGTLLLRRGMSIDDDHPLLAERPELFDSKDPGADLSTISPIERATAAPGEIRATPGTGPRGNRVPRSGQ